MIIIRKIIQKALMIYMMIVEVKKLYPSVVCPTLIYAEEVRVESKDSCQIWKKNFYKKLISNIIINK